MEKLHKCIFCGCIMAECITEEEAIEAFNNRVTEAEIRAKAIDEFAEMLNKKITDFVLEHQSQLTFVSGVSMGWKFVDEIVERLKEKSSVVKEILTSAKDGGWIPCSERMPSEEEMKTAYCGNKYGSEFIVMIDGATRPTTLYRTLDGFWVDDIRRVYEVLAWQPLPPKYEPQRGEET